MTLNKTIKLLGISALAVVAATACTKDFDAINTNPNEPIEVPTSSLLTSAQKGIMDNYWDAFANGRRGNQLAQFWSSNQYSNESRYLFRVGVTEARWGAYYAGTTLGGGLAELDAIIRLNDETNQIASGNPEHQIAIARILKAWMYQNITDIWGPAPYSEALQFDLNPAPKYDSQEEIYLGLLTELKEAADQITASTGGNPIVGDNIYNGDMSKWLRFANSLRLRVAMRIADVNPSLAADNINEVVNSGELMASYDESAFYNYGSGAPDNNPLNEDAKTRNDFAASNIMVDELKRLNDPRLEFYYAPNEDGEFVGEVYGLSESDAALTQDQTISQRNPVLTKSDFPGIYMSAPEVQFLLAEAVERGIITGDAASYYNEGIRLSMNWWAEMNGVTLDPADIDAYIAQPEVDYANQLASAGWKEVIGRQKWIALYSQGIEAWTEWRRLDFGILQLPAAGTLEGSGIPKRLKYPVNEQNLNGNSYNEAVQTKLGGADNQDTRLWWDIN